MNIEVQVKSYDFYYKYTLIRYHGKLVWDWSPYCRPFPFEDLPTLDLKDRYCAPFIEYREGDF